jgi:hypothetical protein
MVKSRYTVVRVDGGIVVVMVVVMVLVLVEWVEWVEVNSIAKIV